MTADEIDEITGILNGTTNYILTKMSKEGLEFDDVLKDAQEKGSYALAGKKRSLYKGICRFHTAHHFHYHYILTKMSKEGLEFDDVLKDAQEKGYAERNPEADVEGYFHYHSDLFII